MPDSTVTPPCEHCDGACCKANGHDFAVLLDEDEVQHFPAAVRVANGPVLPYVNGRCIHLDDRDRCSIYASRPRACRAFNCAEGWRLKDPHHGFFLEDNPKVVELLKRYRGLS